MDIGTIKFLVFASVSVWIAYVSRKSILVIGSHGFYRFFAAEAIIALVLFNAEKWFDDPFSPLQIVSWVFLFESLIMLKLGFARIRKAGKPREGGPEERRENDTLLGFEKTTSLVTTGIYKYIRHPMYASLLFLAWGAFLKDVTLSSVCLVAAATMFLDSTAKADEAECIRFFGSSYKEYMTRTKRFLPYIF
jgi:uncharacterized membrane protein